MENQNIRAANAQQIQQLGDDVLLASGKIGFDNIDYTSETGNKYVGQVKYKKPAVGDLMKMSGIKTAYIQSQFINEDGTVMHVDPALVDDMLLSLAEVVSTLKVVLSGCPVWLMDIDAIDDVDLLYHVFGRYTAWRNSFRTRGAEQPKADSESSTN